MPAAPNVVNLRDTRRANERGEGIDQISAVDVVADLFAVVTEDAIRAAGHGANHQVGKEPVKLGAGVRRTSEAAPAKANRRHVEVASVFLDEQIGRGF